MVIDTSAIIAILRNEAEGTRYLELLRRDAFRLLAAPTAIETAMVMLSRFGEAGLADLREFVEQAGIDIVPLTADHIDLAIDAFRRFGKGRHRAGLNFGDCFSYALARARDEPLLFKGDDFVHTDLRAAA